jgi:hypothetical protein
MKTRTNDKQIRKLQSVYMSMIYSVISEINDELQHTFEDCQEDAQEADIFSDATICWDDR